MSQFDGLLDIKTEKKKTPKEKSEKKKTALSPTPKIKEIESGKSLGKSADSNYSQTSLYIKKDTQISVKSALLTDSQKRDFSELVEELLTDWLKK